MPAAPSVLEPSTVIIRLHSQTSGVSFESTMDSSSTIVEFTRVYLAVFYTCVAVFYTIRITAMKRAGLREVIFAGGHEAVR